MKMQSEKYERQINECYQELGKYTRTLVANKRRTLPNLVSSRSRDQNKVKNQVTVVTSSTAEQYVDKDNAGLVFDSYDGDAKTTTLKEISYGNKKYQLPETLVQELGFYLLVFTLFVVVNNRKLL